MEWGRLRDEITGASVKFGDLLRTAPAATTIVPPSSWSVADLGAHLVSLPRRYARMLDDDQAAFPERMSALNQAEIEAIDPRDRKQLADLLEADTKRGNSARSKRLPSRTICCHYLRTSSIGRSPSVPQARITFAYEVAMNGRSAYVTAAQ